MAEHSPGQVDAYEAGQMQIAAPELSDVATRNYLEFLVALDEARNTLNRMMWLSGAEPLNDAEFDALDAILGEQLAWAGLCRLRFQNRRDCEGEC